VPEPVLPPPLSTLPPEVPPELPDEPVLGALGVTALPLLLELELLLDDEVLVPEELICEPHSLKP
jgi:hypothetical protein